MASETIIANLKAVLNVGMEDSARGIKEAEFRIDAFSKKMEEAVKRMNDSSSNLLGNRGDRLKVQEFENTFQAIQRVTSEVGALQRELVAAGRPQRELRQLAEAYRKTVSQLLPLDKKHSEELARQMGMSKAAFNVEGVVSKKKAVKNLAKEMEQLRLNMQSVTNVEGDISPQEIERQLAIIRKVKANEALQSERVAVETQQRITKVNQDAAERQVVATKNAQSRKIQAIQDTGRKEIQAITELARARAAAIEEEAARKIAATKLSSKAQETAINEEFDNELALIQKMGRVKRTAAQQAALAANEEIKAKIRKTRLTEAEADAELRLKKAKLETGTTRKLAREAEMQQKINLGLQQQQAAYKKVQTEVSRLEKLQTKLAKEAERAQKALSSKGIKDAATSATDLTASIRNLSSATVLAVGPLSGIGARLTALTAIAGRADLKMALLFATISGGVAILAKLAKEAIRVAKELDQVERLLGFVDKGGREQGETFKFLAKQADLYGLALSKIARPFAKFAFATRAAGIEGRRFQRMVEDISAVSGAFGLPTDEVAGIVKALEQMLSKGRVFAEELRQQLGDRLPGAALAALRTYRKMLGDMNISMGQFVKDMQKGLIDATKFVPAFTRELRDMFGVETGRAVNTLSAAYSRLSTNFDLFVRDLDKSLGFTEELKNLFNDTSAALRVLRGNTEGFAKAMKLLFSVLSLLGGLKLVSWLAVSASKARAAGEAIGKLGIAWRALVGVIGSAVAIVGGKGLIDRIFGTGSESADAAKRAQKAVDHITQSIRGSTKEFDLSGALFGNEASIRKELDRMVTVFKKDLESGIVIRPSVDPDALIDSVTSQITGPQDKITSAFNKALKSAQRFLSQSSRPASVDKWTREVNRLKTGLKKHLDQVERTNAPYDAWRERILKVSDQMAKLDEKTKATAQAMTFWGSVVQFLIGNADTLVNILSTVVAGIAALQISTVVLGFTRWGQTMTGLIGKMGRFKKALGLVGLALTGVAAALAFFSSEAKAAIKDTDDLTARIDAFFKAFEQSGQVSLQSTSRIIEDIKAQRDANKRLIDDLVTQIVRYKAAVKQNATNMYEPILTQIRKNVGNLFNIRNVQDAVKALDTLKSKNSELAIDLSRAAGLYNTLLRKIGDADRALLRSGRGGEGAKVYVNLLDKIERVNQELFDVRNSTSSAEIYFRKLGEEGQALSLKLRKVGLTAEVVSVKIAELEAAQRALFQEKAANSANTALETLRARYEAFSQGQLAVFDKQQRINREVEKFRVELENAGRPMSEITAKTEEYKTKLEALSVSTKKVSASTKEVKTDLDKLDKQIKDKIIGAVDGFADSIAGLAVEGDLTFGSFGDAFKSMAKSIIKDILAMIIKFNVLRPLMQGVFGFGQTSASNSGTGGFLGGAFSNLFSNAVGPGPVKAFAKGGVVNRDTPFSFNGGKAGVFGEAGSEAIIPLKRKGGVLGIADNDGPDKGGMVQINFNVTATDAQSFQKSEGQVSAMLSRAVGRGRRNM